MRHGCILALSALLTACVGPMAAPVPLRSIEYANPSGPAKCLFVFLPGMGDRAESFEQKGFVAELRAHALSADIRATDATFGYYMRGTFLDRLAADVIAPAKARGYQEIWIAGPSMGGFGSLFYTRAHTADISGVLAIAPFLGDRDVIEEITAAGGLEKWKPPVRVDAMSRDNYQREIWRWLQAVTQGRESAPPIFLGYGASDKLGPADSLLRAELPSSHVFMTDGAHEWGAWRRVLKSFLESPEFAGHCRADAVAETAASAATATVGVDATACQARGGEVRPVCRRQVPRCVVRYPDAGKRCSNKSDCQGRCLVDGERSLRPGDPANGRCEEDDDPCGCKFEVKNGKLAGGICVD
jgi:pimeloyl-ACP methyl ester carboxylesterase